MRYTKRTLVISRSRVSEAEGFVARQRDVVDRLKDARHPADDSIALLLVMEQSLLSMKRFLSTVERVLEQSLGLEKPSRAKVSRNRAKTGAEELAQQVAGALREEGIDAEVCRRAAQAPKPGGKTDQTYSSPNVSKP